MTKQAVQTSAAPSAIGPYSQGIRAGNLLFVSGQIPLDPQSGEIIVGGIEEQTKRVLTNLKAIIEAGGATMNDVVRTTIYLKDMSNFSRVNDIYGTFFVAPFPARATIEVARLPRDVGVEIDAIANVRI